MNRSGTTTLDSVLLPETSTGRFGTVGGAALRGLDVVYGFFVGVGKVAPGFYVTKKTNMDGTHGLMDSWMNLEESRVERSSDRAGRSTPHRRGRRERRAGGVGRRIDGF